MATKLTTPAAERLVQLPAEMTRLFSEALRDAFDASELDDFRILVAGARLREGAHDALMHALHSVKVDIDPTAAEA